MPSKIAEYADQLPEVGKLLGWGWYTEGVDGVPIREYASELKIFIKLIVDQIMGAPNPLVGQSFIESSGIPLCRQINLFRNAFVSRNRSDEHITLTAVRTVLGAAKLALVAGHEVIFTPCKLRMMRNVIGYITVKDFGTSVPTTTQTPITRFPNCSRAPLPVGAAWFDAFQLCMQLEFASIRGFTDALSRWWVLELIHLPGLCKQPVLHDEQQWQYHIMAGRTSPYHDNSVNYGRMSPNHTQIG
ncbi:hypothetical protein K438DRAFT_1751148 [Mycena galopus ATCC 62051]|nr:hypothetical protein K438DRAFT_1751148 [Mycena galopus ATCC 62051]